MKVLKTISTATLAILILFSATGLSLVKHYCMGEIKKVSLRVTEDTSTCHMTEKSPSCHQQEGNNNCCDNEKDEVKTDDYNTGAKVKLDNASEHEIKELPLREILTYFSNRPKGHLPYNYTIKGPPSEHRSMLQVFII